MQVGKLRWVAVALLVVWGSPAFGQTRLEKVEYYDIWGSTETDLRREMDRLGPRDGSGKSHDAFTRWYVRWSYQLGMSHGDCRLRSFHTQVEITITLPKWKNESTASSRLLEGWERYLGALGRHEEGHKQIGLDAESEIRRRVEQLGGRQSCGELGQAINATGHKVLEEQRAREIQYDRETKHGATQGARFP